jgi:hypothetical protein
MLVILVTSINYLAVANTYTEDVACVLRATSVEAITDAMVCGVLFVLCRQEAFMRGLDYTTLLAILRMSAADPAVLDVRYIMRLYLYIWLSNNGC